MTKHRSPQEVFAWMSKSKTPRIDRKRGMFSCPFVRDDNIESLYIFILVGYFAGF